MLLLSINEGFPAISDDKSGSCVHCGHCEAVCPTGALLHNETEMSQAPLFQGKAEITPKDLGLYFRNRRSIRCYQSKAVDKKILEEIMDVVRYAPTGMNRQPLGWVVIQDKKKVEEIVSTTIAWMRQLRETNRPLFQAYGFSNHISAYEAGVDLICRDAPHLTITYSAANYPIGAKDATIAATHLELLLPSFGLGGCWAGYLMVALQYSAELKSLIGLNEKHAVHAALLLGYPRFEYQKIPNRNKVNVMWQ